MVFHSEGYALLQRGVIFIGVGGSTCISLLSLTVISGLSTLAGGQAHKRRRTSEPIEIEDRLESLICRVGEKVKER